jgi:hypothetical protein
MFNCYYRIRVTCSAVLNWRISHLSLMLCMILPVRDTLRAIVGGKIHPKHSNVVRIATRGENVIKILA